MSLTLEDINGLLSYNPAAGSFVWKVSTGPRIRVGDMAGSRPKSVTLARYAAIVIRKQKYPAHRIAWFMFYGQWPAGEVDHINGDGFDNRIENLRVVNRSQNNRNCHLRKDNASRLCGVYWHEKKKKWMAHIGDNSKQLQLGGYKDLFAAACARKSAEIHLGYFERHGVAA